MGGDVTEALSNREFLDIGGTLVHDGGFVVATPVTLVRVQVALVGALGMFGGAADVFGRDAFPRGEISLPAMQFLGALGGLATR